MAFQSSHHQFLFYFILSLLDHSSFLISSFQFNAKAVGFSVWWKPNILLDQLRPFHGSVIRPGMNLLASLPIVLSTCSCPCFSRACPQARTLLLNSSYLVWTETLQRIVSKLVSHIHQIIVGVDVVQAVGFCFARGFAHILAVPKETVEVEFVGILAVRCQAGITGIHPKPNHHLHSFHTFVSLPTFNSRGAQLKPLFQTWPTDFP